MTDLLVDASGMAAWGARRFRCALGRGGIVREKREGDGGTPVGALSMRRLLFRFDRLRRPATRLSVAAIRPADGWCDAPGDPRYNLPVEHPYPASAEHLWRDDDVYDLVVPLGWNDDPPVAGRGSAIFLHLAQPDWSPTEGCVALALSDLLEVLAAAGPESSVVVAAP